MSWQACAIVMGAAPKTFQSDVKDTWCVRLHMQGKMLDADPRAKIRLAINLFPVNCMIT
jgi:hypothetical protein